MSNLPNAPLIEVVFNLQWDIKQEEFDKYRYFTGDFYSVIKDDYPIRKNLIPDGIPLPLYLGKPIQRYTKKEGKFPVVQVGPGILSVNTTDEFYYWKEYSASISYATRKLTSLVKEFGDFEQVNLSLNYIDFIPFDFKNGDLYAFFKEKLHIEINQKFYADAKTSDINFLFEFENEIGWMNVRFGKGKFNEQYGIVIDTNAISADVSADIEDIHAWVEKAHEFCSKIFKEMTSGDLYQGFKQ